MERLTHERVNGIKTGYWSPEKKQDLVDRLSEYEDTGLTPDQIRQIDILYVEKCREVAELRKAQGWIPVEERLPINDEGAVEVTVRSGYRAVGYYDQYREEWRTLDEDGILDVIAWKESSEPYRPEQTEVQRPEWQERMLHTFLGGHA